MAFFNLFDNSVKYSGDQKCIQVRVQSNDSFVDLAVRTTDWEFRTRRTEKIFEKFYRGTAQA